MGPQHMGTPHAPGTTTLMTSAPWTSAPWTPAPGTLSTLVWHNIFHLLENGKFSSFDFPRLSIVFMVIKINDEKRSFDLKMSSQAKNWKTYFIFIFCQNWNLFWNVFQSCLFRWGLLQSFLNILWRLKCSNSEPFNLIKLVEYQV